MVFLRSLIILLQQYFSTERFPLFENLNENLSPYSQVCLSWSIYICIFVFIQLSACSLYGVSSTIKPSLHPYFVRIRPAISPANLCSICLSTVRAVPSNGFEFTVNITVGLCIIFCTQSAFSLRSDIT